MATQTWTLVCGGDLMFNGIPTKVKPLKELSSALSSADLAIANLEIPLTTSKDATSRKTKEDLRRRDQFVLKGDPKHGAGLKEAGLDMVSLGNNHTMDYGASGLKEQQKLLDRLGILHTGASTNAESAYRPAVFTLPNGYRVGMISALAFVTRKALLKATPAAGGNAGIAVMSLGGIINDSSRTKIHSWTTNSKKKCDFLIVGLHWGTERKVVPDPWQVNLGRAFVDAGADLVWGHHPHVLQGAEVYRGKPILYSCGNLVSALPADSALFKLGFESDRLTSFDLLPAILRNGKTSSAKDADAARISKAFDTSGQTLLKKFPSRDSKQLTATWRKPR